MPISRPSSAELLRRLSLQRNQFFAHGGHGGHGGSRHGDLFRADLAGDVLAVQIHMLRAFFIAHFNIRLIYDALHLRRVVKIDPRPQRGKCRRAVHRAGVQI